MMASSLEDLLAEEGFRGRRSMTSRRSSFGLESLSMPPHRQRNSESTSQVKIRTERTRSDVSRYNSRGELPTSERVKGRRPRDNLVRIENLGEGSKKETREKFKGRDSDDLQEVKRRSVDVLNGLPESEIIELGEEDNERFKDIYSDEVYSSERRVEKERSGENVKLDKRNSNNYSKNMFGHSSFSNSSRQSMKEPGTSYGSSQKSSWNSKSYEDKKSQRRDNIVDAVSEPGLDEVAVQAMVSILTGYIKRFLTDDAFRTSLRDSCFSSLNCIELEEGYKTERKVISNLEQAILTVERAAEESATAKDLKKASLQLSVITGLSSNDMKDRFTYGVPNYKLSACAHSYLSVIYKLQKKDRLSAKHLLQVFCDSPLQARTALLPELWDYLFLPHLTHLKLWYNQEVDMLADIPTRSRKLKLLEKVYNDILNSGTYQFAVYYKDWLTEGVEAPLIPSIHIPSESVRGTQHGGVYGYSSEQPSPAGTFSPQPMVSRRLYDAVFSRANKLGVEEVEVDEYEENISSCLRSSDGSVVEDKQAVTDSFEAVKCTNQEINQSTSKNTHDNASHKKNELSLTVTVEEEAWKFDGVNAPGEEVLVDEVGDMHIWKGTNGSSQVYHAPLNITGDELILKSLAKSIFELQQTDSSIGHTVSSILHSIKPIKIRSSTEELHGGSFDYCEKGLFSSIPQDFICPLTGQLFEDPVTLETGQTIERAALRDWFDKGNRTCPVTGKTLEFVTVPLTNFVLKRVIDSWKSNHGRSKPKDVTAVKILQQLLTGFSEEEKIKNTKHLLSLGGLQFLMQRFEYGNLEEKTHIAALLSCCIEADPGCRYQIARIIKKGCLLDLLHSKQVKARENAVLLLIELICLNRRKDITYFLSGLKSEENVNTMHVLLVYLQSSPPEQRPLIAIFLLHLDLVIEPRKYSVYREEAVDAIIMALDCSLTDEKIRAVCCRALLILGGHFSISGKVLTERYILTQAGYDGSYEADILDSDKEGLQVYESIPLDDEEQTKEEWLRCLSASLLGDGKKSFLEIISKCLGSGNLDLVKVCLTTVAWLSCALTSVSNAEFQLSAFSALISRLKEILENGVLVEHKILASTSLLNFSKIPECRVLLMTIAEEIVIPLRGLLEKTWTAKELHAIISGEAQ